MNNKNEHSQATRTAWMAIPLVMLIGAGLAWSGSDTGQLSGGIPIFALGVAVAFLIQWLVFLPSYMFKTERFFDLTGSITFLSVIGLSLALSKDPSPRSLMLFGLIAIWAIRLGSFLYMRIRRAGEDKRFRELKASFSFFLLTWTLQGLWVSFSLAAALAAITTQESKSLGLIGLIGILVWLVGFSFEVIADQQKSRFKAEKKNAGKFIQSGLWAWSRHPNYFGEILVWLGIALIAFPVLNGWQYLTLISPIFVFLLLTRISGIPMLERNADEKWGGQGAYEEYKAQTPILIPRLPKQ